MNEPEIATMYITNELFEPDDIYCLVLESRQEYRLSRDISSFSFYRRSQV
jgi:hypothetical protein